jgi:drug/metabolite transporter (DMT)-like permease
VLGFVGAFIVAQPWSSATETSTIGALFLFAAALTNAGYQIATRRLRDDDPMTSLLFTAAAGALVTSLLLPTAWQSPTLFQWTLLVSSGLLGCLGHLCLIKAFQCAPASVVAPFSYSSIIWAVPFGFTIWGDVPSINTLAGAALIITSGLYIYFRERKLSHSV